jgi:serine/threonine protein kinase
MNAEQVKQLLGLEVSVSNEAALAELNHKRTQLEEKRNAAPTDALKAKFEQSLKQLAEAEKALRQSASPAPRSPLSETKMADLPGMAPKGSQGDATGIQQLHLQPGDILAGRYEIKEQIGAGGMGAVYRVHDQNRAEDIAIKVLLPSLTAHERARERFLDEARLSSKLSHPNIVNVYDVQHDGELFFITMELLEGQDLRGYLDNIKTLRQQVVIDDARRIVGELATGLAYAHQYTVHRDIKPENIWLTDTGAIKLMDFGIARLMSASQRTQTGAAMGTAYYMAPEQLKGISEIDGRADQYALGVLLYEMLAGEVPAGRIEPLNKLRKDAPKSLSQAVDKCLSANPDNRYPDVASFNAAISRKSVITMPALPLRQIGMVAGVVFSIAVVAGLASSGGLSELYDAIRPVSQEELAAQKSRAVNLKGQMTSIKNRLEEARRRLSQEVRDADRNRESNALTASLNYWQTLTEENLFGGAQWVELQGEEAVADTYLQDKQYLQSEDRFGYLLEQYQKMYDAFNGAEHLYAVAELADAQQRQYLEERSHAQLPDAVQQMAATQLNQKMEDARQSIIVLDFAAATRAYKEAAIGYEQARNELDSVVTVQRDAESSRERWESYLSRYSLNFDEGEKVNAERALAEANAALSKGDIVAAEPLFNQSRQHYAELQSAGEQVVAQQQAAERRRQEKQAAEKAARDRAERERLAKIAAETAVMDKVEGAQNTVKHFFDKGRKTVTKRTEYDKYILELWSKTIRIGECELGVSSASSFYVEDSNNGSNDDYYGAGYALAGIKSVDFIQKTNSSKLDINSGVISPLKFADYVRFEVNDGGYKGDSRAFLVKLSSKSTSEKKAFTDAIMILKVAAEIKGCKKTL